MHLPDYHSHLQAWYLAVASLPCVRTVCEIGFNAGHSSTVRPSLFVCSFFWLQRIFLVVTGCQANKMLMRKPIWQLLS